MSAKRSVLSALAALALAVVIYLGWRSGLNLHRVLPIAALRQFGVAHPLPGWARNSLPDALWQYAFTAIVAALWQGHRWDARKVAFVGVPALAGAIIEILQLVRVFPGTFDWMDLALSVAASAVALATTAGRALPRSPPSARARFRTLARGARGALRPATGLLSRPDPVRGRTADTSSRRRT